MTRSPGVVASSEMSGTIALSAATISERRWSTAGSGSGICMVLGLPDEHLAAQSREGWMGIVLREHGLGGEPLSVARSVETAWKFSLYSLARGAWPVMHRFGNESACAA